MFALENVQIRCHLFHLGLDRLLGLTRNEGEDKFTFLDIGEIRIKWNFTTGDLIENAYFWRVSHLSTHNLLITGVNSIRTDTYTEDGRVEVGVIYEHLEVTTPVNRLNLSEVIRAGAQCSHVANL